MKIIHNKINISWFRKNGKSIFLEVCNYTLLIGFVFVFLFPFLYMFTTSIKHPIDLLNITTKWLVKNPNWRNYRLVIDEIFYWRGLWNSTFVSVLSAVGQVLTCSFVAYGIARYNFPGKNLIFSLIIFSLIIPPQVFVIPLFIQYSGLNMIDTFLPIILPGFFATGLKGGLFVFIFVQFFKGLPPSLEEAARIDGCSAFAIYRKIIMPLSSSSILVTGILSIVWHWNDFFEPSVYLHNPAKSLLSMSINLVMHGRNFYMNTDGGFVNPIGMAGAALSILPIFILFLILQKRFMTGVERTGLAGF